MSMNTSAEVLLSAVQSLYRYRGANRKLTEMKATLTRNLLICFECR